MKKPWYYTQEKFGKHWILENNPQPGLAISRVCTRFVQRHIRHCNDDGSWFSGLDQMDQTCEVICWWSEIQKNFALL